MGEGQGPNFLVNPGVPEIPEHVSGSAAPTATPAPIAPEEPVRRPGFGKRWMLYAVLLLLALLALFSAPLLYGGIRAGAGVLAFRNDLQTARSASATLDFRAMLSAVTAAQDDLDKIGVGLRATGNWRYLPWIGSRLRALEDAEKAGSSALAGFRELAEAAASIQNALQDEGIINPAQTVAGGRSFNDLTPDEKRFILSQMNASLPNIRRARERIAIASETWESLPKDELFAPARAALEPLAGRLPEFSQELESIASLIEILLPLLGYPDERTYLILLQNADELRATGGFIGNVGEVTVSAADFKKIDIQDVYAVDNPVSGVWKEKPPEILERELKVPAWFLRDANWSPDFPQTAERVMDFYERETALAGRVVRLDSVLALQPGFFKELLKLTGPVTVDGKIFDAGNFFDELQYDVEMGAVIEGVPRAQRKEVVGKLGFALLDKLMTQPASRWPSILRATTDALAKKDILIYSRDPDLQNLLEARDWSGRTKPSAGDYLWVIDTNLAAFKTDGVMDKKIFYSFESADPNDMANRIAVIRLRYRNTNTKFTWRYTRYRSYTRVYVPEGSELLSWSGASRPDVYRELGKNVFGAFWTIEPGDEKELVFRYRLPRSLAEQIASGEYLLTVQKQPGNRSSLTLDLAFGKKLRIASPPEDEERFGDERYQIADWDLTQGDQLFEVKW